MELTNLFKTVDINSGVKKYRAHQKAVLLDVREAFEYNSGHIYTSVNLPLQKIDHITELVPDKSTPIYVHCLSGSRSSQALSFLKKLGYSNAENIGGISSYRGKIMKGN